MWSPIDYFVWVTTMIVGVLVCAHIEPEGYTGLGLAWFVLGLMFVDLIFQGWDPPGHWSDIPGEAL